MVLVSLLHYTDSYTYYQASINLFSLYSQCNFCTQGQEGSDCTVVAAAAAAAAAAGSTVPLSLSRGAIDYRPRRTKVSPYDGDNGLCPRRLSPGEHDSSCYLLHHQHQQQQQC